MSDDHKDGKNPDYLTYSFASGVGSVVSDIFSDPLDMSAVDLETGGSLDRIIEGAGEGETFQFTVTSSGGSDAVSYVLHTGDLLAGISSNEGHGNDLFWGPAPKNRDVFWEQQPAADRPPPGPKPPSGRTKSKRDRARIAVLSPTFKLVFLSVLALTIMSGAATVFFAWVWEEPTRNQQATFDAVSFTWKLGMGAILGLLGGKVT